MSQTTTVVCPISGKKTGTIQRYDGWQIGSVSPEDLQIGGVVVAPATPGSSVLIIATLQARGDSHWKAAEKIAQAEVIGTAKAAGEEIPAVEVEARVKRILDTARAGDEAVAAALNLPPEEWVEVRVLNDISAPSLVNVVGALDKGAVLSGALKIPLDVAHDAVLALG